jgi:hypothetical protein
VPSMLECVLTQPVIKGRPKWKDQRPAPIEPGKQVSLNKPRLPSLAIYPFTSVFLNQGWLRTAHRGRRKLLFRSRRAVFPYSAFSVNEATKDVVLAFSGLAIFREFEIAAAF